MFGLGDLTTPMKWMSDLEDEITFEKQKASEIWIEYDDKKISARYIQVSVSSTESIYPEVIIRKIDDNNLLVRLSEGDVYVGTNSTYLPFKVTDGRWVKNKGKNRFRFFLKLLF